MTQKLSLAEQHSLITWRALFPRVEHRKCCPEIKYLGEGGAVFPKLRIRGSQTCLPFPNKQFWHETFPAGVARVSSRVTAARLETESEQRAIINTSCGTILALQCPASAEPGWKPLGLCPRVGLAGNLLVCVVGRTQRGLEERLNCSGVTKSNAWKAEG